MGAIHLTPELRAALRKNALMAVFDEAGLDELIGRLELNSRRMGESVVVEGEPGDCAYIVYSGRCRVLKQGTGGKGVTLGSLGPGNLFGEQAILTGRPRSATVRASEDCVLLRLSKHDFEGLLTAHPEVREYLERFLKDRAVVDFLRSATFLGNLPPRDLARLLDRLQPRDYPAGTEIIRQGEPGSEMYLLVSGEVQVTQRVEGLNRTLAHLSPGQYFGERALLSREPRSATVTSLTQTRCLTLSDADLTLILERTPQVRDDFVRRMEQYTITEEMQQKYGLKPPEPVRRRQLSFEEPAGAAGAPPAVGPAPLGEGAVGDSPGNSVPADEGSPRRKWQKLRRGPAWERFPIVRQLDEMDCGPASLAMISKWYGISVSISRLREITNAGREGSSLYGLSTAAEKLGYSTRALRTDYGNLCHSELPAIAHWKGYHFVVVYEAGPGRATVGDPAIGLVHMQRAEFEQGWTGRVLLLTATDRLEEVEPEVQSWARFLPLLVPFRWLLFEIVIASLILNLLQLAAPMITQTIVDRVLLHSDRELLRVMLVGMCLIAAFQTLSRLLRQYLLMHVSQKLKLRMSADLFRFLVRLPMRFFQSRRIGELLQRFQDNQRLQQVMTGQAIGVLLDLLMVFASLGLMLYYNPRLTAVAVLPIPAYVFLTAIFTPMLKRNHLRQVEQEARTESTLIETLNAIAAIKGGAAEMAAQWRHESNLAKLANIDLRSARQWMQMSAISSSIQIAASMIVLWYGAVLVMDGELSVGQLMAFQSLIGMLVQPIMALMGVWNQLSEALASLKRLNDLYDTKPELDPRLRLPPAPLLTGHMRLENVSFRYSADGKNILTGINLEVPSGRKVALVGRSGSGKTTLAMLLQRFHDPTEGRIVVDGCDLTKIEVRSYREQVGVVSQDSTLFSGTIRENIALSDPDTPLDRVIAISRLANAHDFIMSFPLGYETVVGEAGVRLSGGQRQRICIARALLRDPRILIFDEATSALDTESEKVIQENMKVMLAGRTSFVIAHRLSTVQDADQILVLDEGLIVEKGTHRELLALKGLYYYLASQQLNS